VVSRVEELANKILDCGYECEAGPLANNSDFQELIATLAQRDKWIADLELDVRQFHAAFKSARAEVPEWCEKMIRDLRRGIAVHLVLDDIPKDQLRACGIEAP